MSQPSLREPWEQRRYHCFCRRKILSVYSVYSVAHSIFHQAVTDRKPRVRRPAAIPYHDFRSPVVPPSIQESGTRASTGSVWVQDRTLSPGPMAAGLSRLWVKSLPGCSTSISR